MRKPVALCILSSTLLVACSSEPENIAANNTPAETAAPAESEATMAAAAPEVCLDFGPQTPRDISSKEGTNPIAFAMAPESTSLNLCNIHTHTNAEHKGPGFSVFVSDADDGGYACNGGSDLSRQELTDPWEGEVRYQGVKPGDTIEVHWVHSSCDVSPGEGLGACLSEGCDNPLLRVEAQAFLVVNDPTAIDFMDFAYSGGADANGFHQPKDLPGDSGEPVVFRGSTTGPSYDQQTCSPLNVTWSVRPQCKRVDISSLHRWAQDNPFKETKSHGVRQLVTDPRLLSPID